MLIVKSKSRLAVVTGVIGVVTALAVWGGRCAKAWPDCQTCKRTLLSGMVGVTQGETVRLIAVNTVPMGRRLW